MLYSFELTMPGVNSWNGRWSGANNKYVLVRSVLKSNPVEEKTYLYDFEDGWRAAVYVKIIDAKQARHLRKHSDGFCGYNWMVDEILQFGEIKGRHK
jgi:hypothetical protein